MISGNGVAVTVCNGPSVNTTAVLSKALANDVVAVPIYINSQVAPYPVINTVRSPNISTWFKRAEVTGNGFFDFNPSYAKVELWYGIVPIDLTNESITVNTTTSNSGIIVGPVAFSGLNLSFTVPWDTNGSLPATASHNTSPGIVPAVTLSTDLPHDLLVYFAAQYSPSSISFGRCPMLLQQTGWSIKNIPTGQQQNVFSGYQNWAGGMYMTTSAQVSSDTITGYDNVDPAVGITNWIVIADALRCAGN